jgi:hypothetical protein
MLDTAEEYFLFVKRYMQFHNIWTVYFDFLSGRYVPSLPAKTTREVVEVDSRIVTEMGTTLMFVLYAFFYSLIEDSDDGLNAFRVWRAKYPEEERAIIALEKLILPFRQDLKVFRNRMGFHGSRSQQHEVKGFDLFGNYSGTDLIERMTQFKALNAALIEKNLALQVNSVERLQDARSRIDRITERCEAMGG